MRTKEFFMSDTVPLQRKPDAGINIAVSEGEVGLGHAFGSRTQPPLSRRTRKRSSRAEREKKMELGKYGVTSS